jgi:hypothetical protein
MATTDKMATEERQNSFTLTEKKMQDEEAIENSRSPEWQAASKSLVRKLDMTLLPTIWILYVFNYLDRNNIA